MGTLAVLDNKRQHVATWVVPPPRHGSPVQHERHLHGDEGQNDADGQHAG